jgi:aarF domain-containing kinase
MDPHQMYYACGRVVRTTTTAARMAMHYRFSDAPREVKHTQAALIIKDCCIKNAGVYIKLGQLLATLEVIVPQEYTEVLKSMYEHAPVSSPHEIRTTVEREFGCRLETVFSEFDWTPISSASIAQVHRAKLRETGQSVAVKVQHDWLREQLPIDIKLTTALVIIGEALFPDELNFRWLLYDLKKELPKELNFKIEAQNSQNIQKCFADDPRIKIPEVYPKYLTERVMIQEYITDMVPPNPFPLLNKSLDKH